MRHFAGYYPITRLPDDLIILIYDDLIILSSDYLILLLNRFAHSAGPGHGNNGLMSHWVGGWWVDGSMGSAGGV